MDEEVVERSGEEDFERLLAAQIGRLDVDWTSLIANSARTTRSGSITSKAT
jgi:hypothetical protein